MTGQSQCQHRAELTPQVQHAYQSKPGGRARQDYGVDPARHRHRNDLTWLSSAGDRIPVTGCGEKPGNSSRTRLRATFELNIGADQMTQTLIERIANGRTDLALDLVAAGGSASSADLTGTTVSQWCAYYGDVGSLRFLLDHGASLHQLGEDFGLNAAAFHGHWQLCQFLLEKGAPVASALPDTGETPLHSALCSDDRVKYDPVVQVLLSYGADPNAVTLFDKETGAFMRDCRTRGETPLHRAAAFGTLETIHLLIDAGAHKEARDAHGDTPLSWGSWYRRPDDILRALCYGRFHIRQERRSLRENLVGKPILPNAL